MPKLNTVEIDYIGHSIILKENLYSGPEKFGEQYLKFDNPERTRWSWVNNKDKASIMLWSKAMILKHKINANNNK